MCVGCGLLWTITRCSRVAAFEQQKIYKCLSKWVKSRGTLVVMCMKLRSPGISGRIILRHATSCDVLAGNPFTPYSLCVRSTLYFLVV